jgi:hypothetical protein
VQRFVFPIVCIEFVDRCRALASREHAANRELARIVLTSLNSLCLSGVANLNCRSSSFLALPRCCAPRL